MADELTPNTSADDDAGWLAELADSAVPPSGAATVPEQPASSPAPYLPPLVRVRPERPALVPRWVLWSVAAAVLVIVLALVTVALVSSSRRTTVPGVTGVTLSVAQTRLASAGLKAQVAERRFSTEPKDTVLSQDPADGTTVRRGDTVQLVISAGTEDFPMPDVINQGLVLARGTLEAKGLVVTVEPIISDAASDTVLASTPAPGALVRTGDTVVLQVSAPRASGASLQPYRLDGIGITVDAAPIASGTADISLEVARRLRALLEASGAIVTMLRTSGDTSTVDTDRALRAAEVTATLAVGFDLSQPSTSGRVVEAPSLADPRIIASSATLASAVTSELVSVAPPARSSTTVADTVLAATQATFVRVRLGSALARDDLTAFADPAWADKVARAVYTAIGKLYGAVEQP